MRSIDINAGRAGCRGARWILDSAGNGVSGAFNILVLWLSCLGLWAGANESGRALTSSLTDYLSEDRFAQATWGLHIESLETGTVLFSSNGHRLLQPASSAKLLVAALALDQFGSQPSRVTTLHAEVAPDAGGVLSGRLFIRGAGDFSWSDRFGAGRPEAILDLLTRLVRNAGIREIRGGLIGDTQLFRGPAWGAGWAWDDLQYGYGGEVDALMFRDGRLEVRVQPGDRIGSACVAGLVPSASDLEIVNLAVTGDPGEPGKILTDRRPGSRQLVVTGRWPLGAGAWSETLSEPNPARAFLQALREALVAGGVQVHGPNHVLDWRAAREPAPDYRRMPELGRVNSPPTGEMVRVMMGSSQNQYAQILLLWAGAHRETQRATERIGTPSWTADQGLEALREFLDRMGVRREEVRLDEAAGLARSDRVTPAALVRVLRGMRGHREHASFVASLPVQELETERGTVRLRAKSGTMSDIYTLAGYLERPVGEPVIFSVMLNGYVPAQPGGGHRAVAECMKRVASLGWSEAIRD